MSLPDGLSPAILVGLICLAALLVLLAAVLVAIRRQKQPQPPVRPGAAGPAPVGLPPGIEARLLSELAAGRKIEAVKFVREQTGLGLRQAKELVEQMLAGQPGTDSADLESDLSQDELSRHIQTRSRTTSKIELIHWVRQRTGWGLKEAKSFVEAELTRPPG